jgi:hypothetical protein
LNFLLRFLFAAAEHIKIPGLLLLEQTEMSNADEMTHDNNSTIMNLDPVFVNARQGYDPYAHSSPSIPVLL